MRRPIADRFWEKVERSDTCWLWTAALSPSGYGAFQTGERVVRAHRFAYELVVGPIPDGLQIDHLCRVRRCVNPEHLEPVTQAENLRRGTAATAVAAYWAAQTHCKRGHEFTPENTYRGTGRRVCRACCRLRASGYRQAAVTA